MGEGFVQSWAWAAAISTIVALVAYVATTERIAEQNFRSRLDHTLENHAQALRHIIQNQGAHQTALLASRAVFRVLNHRLQKNCLEGNIYARLVHTELTKLGSKLPPYEEAPCADPLEAVNWEIHGVPTKLAKAEVLVQENEVQEEASPGWLRTFLWGRE